MTFTVDITSQLTQTDCIIVAVYAQNELSTLAKVLDEKSAGSISHFLEQQDFSGKLNETSILYLSGLSAPRVLLVGCGDKKGMTEQKFFKLLRSIATPLKQIKTKHILYALPELKVGQHDLAWQFKQAIFNIKDELYTFTQFKSKTENSQPLLTHMSFYAEKDSASLSQSIQQGLVLVNNVKFARDLANLPANICTPSYLAEQAQLLSQQLPLSVEVLDKTQMQELKMGALLAVAQGSQHAPKLVIIHYQGAADKNSKPIVLVGKGVTFDTGGINLKPSHGIVGMKYDKCGAISVLATLKSVAELKLPLNIIGVMPCVENMIGSHAFRPDDVITSMSGQTIEINNTDAEGRLILCDALTYCERFQPEIVIDIATLTGAVITALGRHASGLFSNDQTIADALLKAGLESGDRVWQLPLWEDYQPQLDSVVADMVNSAGSAGGANSITAACFLSRFTKDYHWAHLDIAGTAFQTGSKAFATGRPVPLLLQYLIDRSHG